MVTEESNFRSQSLEPKNLLLFFTIAFGWTMLLGSLFIFGVLEMPADIGTPGVDLASAGFAIVIVLLLPFGPTISSFLITAKTKGREGIRALWKRFWNRKISKTWLLAIFLFYPVFYLLVRYSALFLTQTEQPALAWLSTPWILLAPFLASILHGGFSEEFGWRGYALPHLQARFNAVTSSIILGFIEGLWHIPLAFIPGMAGWEGRAIFVFFIYWIPISIARTWIFNNTNGSVLAAMLFHAMGNTGSELIPVNVPELIPSGGWIPYLMLILVPIVVIIVLVFGYKDLVRERKIKF